jgi:type VI secretion system FHA domain protein
MDPPRAVRPASPAPAVESSAPIPENWFDDSTAGSVPPPSVRSEPRGASPRAEPAVIARRPRAGGPPSPALEDLKRPPPASGVPSAPANRDSIDMAAVLAAAGVTDARISSEAAQNLGRILRVVVAGVMDMLRARQQTKSALGLDPTIFQRAENNPLKFSSDVEDALHNLFVTHRPGFLGPVEGFEDAFDDVRHHQIAMLHGMRTAFAAMLAQFDPDRLQHEFDRHLKKGALVSVPAKLRYWEMYRETFQEMVKDPETAYRRLFGDEFAGAYEEQLNRLKERK